MSWIFSVLFYKLNGQFNKFEIFRDKRAIFIFFVDQFNYINVSEDIYRNFHNRILKIQERMQQIGLKTS